MVGYAVRVEDETFSDEQKCAGESGELFFVEAEDARERYAIPSAFAAYAEYLNIKIGIG
jgi:A/G-specific adenine glycosylase